MPAEPGSDLKFEIGHVLFIDIVGYSKLLINEQSEQIQKLREIVRATAQFKKAEGEGKLLRLPTGDGGALVFRTNPEAPVLCAIEISRELKKHPELRVRMGIHSGAVNEITDLNEQANIAGAGINIAQRVMDCGDAGHILLSRHVAEDLEQFSHWRPHLHHLGECEVKHGDRVHVVNLYTEELGNPEMPAQFKQAARAKEEAATAISKPVERPTAQKWAMMGATLLIIAAVVIGILISLAKRSTTGAGAITSTAAQEKSIAVLPFDNQNRDPNTDYFSDGIPESIINSLSQLPNLKVMSRNSVFHYKGKDTDAQVVAKELKVQAVLTGRMTQRGNGLSISVELINAQDNSQIWGQQYNRKLADVFAVQEEIAKEISEKLRVKLSGTERRQLAKRPTENLRALQYYMQGRSYRQRNTREDLLAAIHYCEKAIGEDRNYALAYTGLADAYATLGLYGYIAPIEGRRKAEEAARKALALDENLAEAHVALGLAYVTFAPCNFSLGDRELRRAIELSPSLAVAHFYLGFSLTRQGRLDEALEELPKARELDPLSSIIARLAALPYYLSEIM